MHHSIADESQQTNELILKNVAQNSSIEEPWKFISRTPYETNADRKSSLYHHALLQTMHNYSTHKYQTSVINCHS